MTYLAGRQLSSSAFLLLFVTLIGADRWTIFWVALHQDGEADVILHIINIEEILLCRRNF
jgi:hypothetical protein